MEEQWTYPRWEHRIEYMRADASMQAEFLQRLAPARTPPIYEIRSLVPALDSFGAQGWELVQMLPVQVGVNGDIAYTTGSTNWMNTYLCVFKRPKREP